MSGRAGIRDYNEVTGEFCIFALHQDVGAVQSELELRSLCDHIRLICSLGEGTFLRAPIIEIYKPEHLNIICFETARTFPPEWPIIHYRLMEGFINVAVRSFGNLDIKKLPYAIEWILMPTTYNEIRMLNRIIALESLVFRNLSNEEKLDSDVAELGKIVREHVHGKKRGRLISKLRRLEEIKLADKIDQLMKKFIVPMDGLPKYYQAIEEAVEVRNKVAHQGFFRSSERGGTDELSERLLILNELLTRLMLSILKYEGRYECYISGHHARSFPACVRLETPASS